MTASDPLLVTDPDEYRSVVWGIGEDVCARARDGSRSLDHHAQAAIDAFNDGQRRYEAQFTEIGSTEDDGITVGLVLRYRPQ